MSCDITAMTLPWAGKHWRKCLCTALLPPLSHTHCRHAVSGVLGGCCQALLHHAGQGVELMLLIDLKQAQKLPLLPQTSPAPPLPSAGALMVTGRLQASCWHLHLGKKKRSKFKTYDCCTVMWHCAVNTYEVFKAPAKRNQSGGQCKTQQTADCQLSLTGLLWWPTQRAHSFVGCAGVDGIMRVFQSSHLLLKTYVNFSSCVHLLQLM